MEPRQPKIEFRCPTPGCGRLLFKVSEVEGVEVEVRCPRCKQTVTARLEREEEAEQG